MLEGDHKAARDYYMIICRDSPTPLSWLGLGITAFVDDDMEAAEIALNEANMLDCRIGRVWGYLALINLMLDRPAIFNRCILQALKYGFDDKVLLERIDSLVKLVQPLGN
ncbi:cilia- and flagella-associated protein 70-like [Macrosteles quadrilineatus]|uniref:cilia- and flagella-associated protein 70-like n=1 Tax=Macrosteles quadrilineatus TaxID=74068 RepID=UPI0023E15DA8|nr:cilia- and flagella-associated protein 70-like [Macrosteles quadrilineatus]